MTIAIHALRSGHVALPVRWRKAQSIEPDTRVEMAAYRGSLAIWRGEAYDGSYPGTLRANGSIYLPADLRRELGWRGDERVAIEWSEDDDTLVLTRASEEVAA